MQWAPIPWLPPEQQDALGQHPCFFTQHSGVSDARVLLSEDIAYGATITVASRAISANFFMFKSSADILNSETCVGKDFAIFAPPPLWLRKTAQNVPWDRSAEAQAGRKFLLRRDLAIERVAEEQAGNMLAELAVALPLGFVEELFRRGLLGKRGMFGVVPADVHRLRANQRGLDVQEQGFPHRIVAV